MADTRVRKVLAGLLMCGLAAAVSGRKSEHNWISPVPEHNFDTTGDLSLWELFGPPKASDYIVIGGDTLRFHFAAGVRGRSLTDADYREIAEELEVEEAAIRAIVDIETGRTRRGFNADDTPIIDFNIKVFRTMAGRRKINLADYATTHSIVFERPDAVRFGSQQRAQHERLKAAMSIDTIAAIEGTFWGMFQIGGFNWKRCGTSSPLEFAELMSRGEREQLDLFAVFIRNSGLLPLLQSKNWTAFARGYNGPSYAVNAYHTRLEAAYRKFKGRL